MPTRAEPETVEQEVANSGTQTIYLVRHAFASHADATRWPDDALRPLTEDGTRKFRAAARGLRRLVPEVELVLSSGYARAWGTAELLHEAAGWPAPRDCPPLEANQPASAALGVLREQKERSIALVGHEPYLSTLASLLCAGGEHVMQLRLKKGAVAVVEVSGEVVPGAGTLLWAVPPKILRALDQ
ncbi:MAG TPA: histidine phosphatase family protein [Gaiellaceae bacterium]|nr:histidine phosphatase family protein [Gaiellaceae bacterium]